MSRDTAFGQQPIHISLKATVIEMLQAIRKGCDAREKNDAEAAQFEVAALDVANPVYEAAQKIEAGDRSSALAMLADVSGAVEAIKPRLISEDERSFFAAVLPSIVKGAQQQLMQYAA